MSPESGPDDTLGPTESLDSDDVRNHDGDVTVTPPDHWQAADRDEMTARGQRAGESHAERLAQEQPDVPEAESGETPAESAHIDTTNASTDDPRPTRRHHGQLDDTPEDGGGFFDETP
ncbi:hypothetical protein GPX89_14975 [Nocardia sp. ET3-3]|uniref:DUF5709 domain-containing protein n=1 Tax=Nocardia terrae TaxID=2675851 RepID=A0A7K1UW33_9NOCA|nr:hypothetical protein [Nocardia terrae]MVU78545.1 hypothetical protein [Nocardia terrae]